MEETQVEVRGEEGVTVLTRVPADLPGRPRDAAAVLVTKSYKPYQARRPSRYRPVDHAGAPSSWRGRGRS